MQVHNILWIVGNKMVLQMIIETTSESEEITPYSFSSLLYL